MLTDLEGLFSERTKGMRRSEIRELLKLTQKPEIISFAGGLPSPSAFPVKEVQQICNDVLKEEGRSALQYGTTEGLPRLKKALVRRMEKKGVECSVDNILITHGCQQALDLAGKVFLNAGDNVVCSLPTYLGGLSAFVAFQANFAGIPIDDNGMNLDYLEETLTRLEKEEKKPKFIYVLPTFHNPAGVTMPKKNRERFIDIIKDHDVLALEDDPYSDLRYEGETIKPLKAFDDEENVVYLGTFSKILSPGFRLGWVVAKREIIFSLVTAKQATDLCTNTFMQYIAYEYLHRGLVDPHIQEIRKLYGRKRKTMLDSMETYFPSEVTWTKPQGGMFCWATIPGIDTKKMATKAIEQKVAYVNGSAFYFDDGGTNSMRLNFSYPSTAEVEEGIRRLGAVIKEELKR